MGNKSWDGYFLDICKQVGKNTKCLSKQIGSVLVKDKSIIATGYNGPPRDIPTCSERYTKDKFLIKALAEAGISDIDKNVCPRRALGYKSGEGLGWCIAGHSERNCLINAARTGACTMGTILYMDCGIPCGDCFIEIINAGVSEIVCTKLKYYDEKSKYLDCFSKVKVRVFEHIVYDKENTY